MAGIVKIDFVIGGTDAVNRAFQSLIQAAQKSGKEQVRVARETSKAVAKAQNENGNPKTAASLYAAQERAAKRAGDKEVAEAKRVAETKVKEARRARERIESDDRRAAARTAAREEASSKEIVGRIRREGEARERREASYDRKQAALRQSQERRGQRTVYAMEHARIDDINHRRGSVRSSVGDAIKRGASTGAGIIQAGAGLVGGYLGTNTVLDAGRAQMDLGKRQALLQNNTGDTKTDFVAMSKSVSSVVGEDAGSVMGGLEKIAGKAGAEGIAQVKDEFLELAKVAKGAGVSMEDLGDVTATLINRGIKSKDLVKNIEALIQQGKDGAVEFKDLATMLDASSGALIKFKMDSTGRSMTAGGLSQIARTYGKSSAAESTNAVVDMARDLGGKADDIKKLSGVEVGVGGKVGRAQLRDINAVLPEIIAGVVAKGNAGKLEGQGGIFTGNSTSITTPLMQAFTLGLKRNDSGRLGIVGEGETAEIKGKDAVKALLSQFEDTLPAAGESAKSFANVMATQSAQTEVAMNKLKNDLGDKLGPVIAKAAPEIVKFITAFGEITAWALSNPFKAAGALMLASMAQSLATAGASSLFDKLLSKAIPAMAVTAGTVNVVGGPGAGGASGLLGGAGAAGGAALGVGLAAAAAVGVAGYGVISGSSGQAKTENDRQSSLNIGGFQAAGDLRRSNTAANRSAAANALGELELAKSDNNVISRFGAGVAGGFKGLAKGDTSLENIVTAIPQLALLRGAGNAIYGAAGEDKKGTDSAIADLKDALAKSNEPAIQAMNATTAAVQALPGAIAAAGGLQQPKVQP